MKNNAGIVYKHSTIPLVQSLNCPFLALFTLNRTGKGKFRNWTTIPSDHARAHNTVKNQNFWKEELWIIIILFFFIFYFFLSFYFVASLYICNFHLYFASPYELTKILQDSKK